MPSVLELDWGSDPATHSAGPAVATYDIIIGSDVAYDEDFYDALLNWVAAFLAQSPATQVQPLLKLPGSTSCRPVHSVLDCASPASVMQVILGIPDRPETRPFWDCVAMHNLAWRYLRRIARPDLATPISICQLFWQPQKPHGVMPLVSRSGSPAANPNTQEVGDTTCSTIASKLCVCRSGASANDWCGLQGTVSTPARNAQRMLFVFDFDWSLVEENRYQGLASSTVLLHAGKVCRRACRLDIYDGVCAVTSGCWTFWEPPHSSSASRPQVTLHVANMAMRS